MDAFSLGLVLAGAGLLMLFVLRRSPDRRLHALRPPFEKHTQLFTPEERALFLVLQQAVAGDFAVFGKLRVADILHPSRHADKAILKPLLRQLSGRRFQFVLCHKADLSVAGVVQMEERSHHRRPHDAPLDPLIEICSQVGLPLVRIIASPCYEVSEIQQKIMDEVRREPVFVAEPDGRKEPRISGLDHIDFQS
ncbi:MAG: hypothetical protein RIQ52_818 [Pseudomonadota bacterium]|jgi:hypothetical protein